MKDMQELVGHLNFAYRVIVLCRAFIRRSCTNMAGLHRPWHKIRVVAGMHQDLHVWLRFLEFQWGFIWRDEMRLGADFLMHADAAGSLGYGI